MIAFLKDWGRRLLFPVVAIWRLSLGFLRVIGGFASFVWVLVVAMCKIAWNLLTSFVSLFLELLDRVANSISMASSGIESTSSALNSSFMGFSNSLFPVQESLNMLVFLIVFAGFMLTVRTVKAFIPKWVF